MENIFLSICLYIYFNIKIHYSKTSFICLFSYWTYSMHLVYVFIMTTQSCGKKYIDFIINRYNKTQHISMIYMDYANGNKVNIDYEYVWIGHA